MAIRSKAWLLFAISLVLLACSPSYKPLSRPYYPYPPPPSTSPPPESGLIKRSPMENLSSPTASPPSIVERTLEDSSPAIQPAPKERTPSKTIEPPTSKGAPQAMASIKLVDNARQLRVNGKVDEAIRTLERAIELDAYNGEAFYEMALCWQNKKDFNKALKFADRAEQVYSKNPEKLKKVYLLKAQILESTGKKEEAYKYRQRAK